jgi:hypothetical protein
MGAAPARGGEIDPNWMTVMRSDAFRFPNRLLDDSRVTFINSGNAATLLDAGAASVLMHTEGLDRHIADHFEDHDTFGRSGDRALFNIGSPYAHLPVAGLWYGLSTLSKDDLNRQRSLTLLSALAITDTTTLALKGIAHNDRPNGDKWSWPSGHTSSSFAVASVLHEYYGWQVGIPAYAVAGIVGWRMMDVGDHWASDVLFGATLGFVVGHTLAGNHAGMEQAGIELTPYFGNAQTPAVGVSLIKRF